MPNTLLEVSEKQYIKSLLTEAAMLFKTEHGCYPTLTEFTEIANEFQTIISYGMGVHFGVLNESAGSPFRIPNITETSEDEITSKDISLITEKIIKNCAVVLAEQVQPVVAGVEKGVAAAARAVEKATQKISELKIVAEKEGRQVSTSEIQSAHTKAADEIAQQIRDTPASARSADDIAWLARHERGLRSEPTPPSPLKTGIETATRAAKKTAMDLLKKPLSTFIAAAKLQLGAAEAKPGVEYSPTPRPPASIEAPSRTPELPKSDIPKIEITQKPAAPAAPATKSVKQTVQDIVSPKAPKAPEAGAPPAGIAAPEETKTPDLVTGKTTASPQNTAKDAAKDAAKDVAKDAAKAADQTVDQTADKITDTARAKATAVATAAAVAAAAATTGKSDGSSGKSKSKVKPGKARPQIPDFFTSGASPSLPQSVYKDQLAVGERYAAKKRIGAFDPFLRRWMTQQIMVSEGKLSPKESLQRRLKKQKYKVSYLQDGKKVDVFASSIRGVRRVVYGKKQYRVFSSTGSDVTGYFKKMLGS